jgi:uncharacterized protein DUF4836
MKTLRALLILLLACFSTMVVLSQKSAVLNYLPHDAKMIVKMNMASLGQKMKWEEFAKSKMFEHLVKDASDEGKAFLRNPKTNGVDMSQGIFLVIPPSNANKKSEPIVYGVPRDTGQFAAMIKKLVPDVQRVKIANGKLFIHKQTAIAWNKDVFLITGDDSKQVPLYPLGKSRTVDEPFDTKPLIEKCKMLLTRQKPAFSNEHFNTLLKEDGDVYMWVNNTESQLQNVKVPQIVGMLNRNMSGGAINSAGVIRFENGSTTMQMKRYLPATIDSLYSKYPTKNINTNLIGKLPGGQPIFACAFGFSPAMFKEVLVGTGAAKSIDSATKGKLRVDDVISAIRGDMSIAVVKVNEGSEEDSITKSMAGIQIFFAGGIHDKQKFDAMSSAIRAEQRDTAKGQPTKKMKPIILSNDSLFVVSLSQTAAQKFLAASSANQEMKKLFASYESYPSACIIDLKTILGFVMQGAAKKRPEEEVRQMSETLGKFDKLVSYGGVYNRGSLSNTSQLTLTNKDENSLKQVIDLIDLFYLMRNKKSSASTSTLKQEGAE